VPAPSCDNGQRGDPAAPSPRAILETMSPVQKSKARDPRSLGLAIGGLVIGVGLLIVVFVIAIPQLTESGTIKVATGAAPLDLGNARLKAGLIARDGPIPLADPTGGTHDVIVQHVGDDPLKGWLAFDARRPGTGRECSLRWDATRRVFTDPCGGADVPADGGDLPRYPVEVNGDEQVAVRLVTPATETPTTEPPTTLLVTGSGRR
jgi:hypothetical protein